MDSLNIYEFRTTIANYINSVQAPAELKRLVLAEMVQGLENQAKIEVANEIKQRDEMKKGSESDE